MSEKTLPTVLKKRPLVFGDREVIAALKQVEEDNRLCERCDGEGQVECSECRGSGQQAEKDRRD